MRASLRVVAVWAAVALACCLLPASERVELDREVGRAEAGGLAVEVRDGLAAVRSFDGVRLVLWAQAPVLHIELTVPDDRERALRVDVHNCTRGAVLSTRAGELRGAPIASRRASCRFELTLRGSETIRLAPPDADEPEPFAFGVLSDVQRGVGEVDEVFARMNEDPELRFIVSTGDLANIGTRDELERFQEELEILEMPFFSTVGNHEMGAPPRHWHELFGPFNVHFTFKDVTFSLVDSGNATLDPEVYDWLDDWLDAARGEVHVVLTHVPPLDPAGLRGGGFRSRKEAAKLMKRLGDARVDALFLGHIHSYYAFSAAGVPSYISGGGGAIQERFDGIERHYLKVRARPGQRLDDVAIVRVD